MNAVHGLECGRTTTKHSAEAPGSKTEKNLDDLWHSLCLWIPKSTKRGYEGRRWPGKIRLVAAGTSSEKSRSHQNGLCDLRVAMSGVDSISFMRLFFWTRVGLWGGQPFKIIRGILDVDKAGMKSSYTD